VDQLKTKRTSSAECAERICALFDLRLKNWTKSQNPQFQGVKRSDAFAAKINEIESVYELKKAAEDVLPEIEKFLDSPEEKNCVNSARA
jgi:hypothetical protein